MPSARRSAQATPAEVVYLELKSCLVNLPASLVSVLENANTPVQNVVVELSYNVRASTSKANGPNIRKTAYAGWSGMPSRRKAAPFTARTGTGRSRDANSAAGNSNDVQALEIDKKFGQLLGLADGQKVDLSLHLDAPLAHTVSIEPLTPADWEIIELHATFLEFNLLSQIRALPNPSYAPYHKTSEQQPHPLVLHLSPTSSADVLVTSLEPTPSSNIPFARISPDAEVIVAPKTRTRPSLDDAKRSKAAMILGKDETAARTSTGTTRHKNSKDDQTSRGVLFFRAVDWQIVEKRFQHGPNTANKGLKIWIPDDSLASKALNGVEWVSVSIIRLTSYLPPLDPSPQTPHAKDGADVADTKKPATRVVAKLACWDDAPDGNHAALSSTLCASLGAASIVGGVVRVEAAPPPLPKKSVRSIQIYPFASSGTSEPNAALTLGGDKKARNEQLRRQIEDAYPRSGSAGDGILDGPLTDGLVLSGAAPSHSTRWEGGLLALNPPPAARQEPGKAQLSWLLGAGQALDMEVQSTIPRPPAIFRHPDLDEPLPSIKPTLFSVDQLRSKLITNLSHLSSVLLTGGIGSGKTSLAQLVAHELRSESFFHVSYFPCSKLVTDESRVSVIKETLERLFIAGSFGAYLGGQALVILDDLDKLCPAETELQIGNENSRSRQVTELLCSMTKQYCGLSNQVVLLATAAGKDAVHNLLIKTHAVKEVLEIKAPNKESRKTILEALAISEQSPAGLMKGTPEDVQDSDKTVARNNDAIQTEQGSGFTVEKSFDFLELAGKTDGYMPGDLILLMARAKSEALIRCIKSLPNSSKSVFIRMIKKDFLRAQQGFTPASLKNVRLHTASTTFSSIGGLESVRKTLIETLQYPTKYARIFAKCPLRLRSGLLLYGYPGCGKTLLASAVAGESGLNFISVKGPEMLNKYIGASEKSVRDLFERAEAARPAILFFDEFDSIAPKRGHDSTGVTDRVVNQLLTQMDGAEGLSGVYVLAATSRPDLIDPALLRPGRLDKSLMCDLPSYDERLDILRVVGKDVPMSDEVREEGLQEMAECTEGYSGADLQALVYNAHLEAIHRALGSHDKGKGLPSESKAKGKRPQRDDEVDDGGDTNAETDMPDFTVFRFGDDDNEGSNDKDWIKERHSIIAQLELIRKSEQHQHQQHQNPSQPHKDAQEEDDDDHRHQHASHQRSATATTTKRSKREKVTITLDDLHSSLQQTRPSISPDERRRLARIYHEFVQGRRSGDIPVAEPSMEVGGRTSLM